MDLDVKALVEVVRRAADEARAGNLDWRGAGWVVLLMTPEQRSMFARMQAVMTLLEGHGNYLMDAVGEGWVGERSRFRTTLRERRKSRGLERSFQRAIGFDQKARQYDHGERFVARAVDLAGMEGFNRVWAGPANLPTIDELARPDDWVARVGGA
jgi:putative hydrolase